MASRSQGIATSILPSSKLYFYGRVTREEAEDILKAHRVEDGLFLLRESIATLGNYAVSVCFGENIHHYSVEKQYNGMFRIAQGKEFPGPVELIQHHQQVLDGFITMPVIPCNRAPHQPIIAFRGMTYADLENELITKADKMKVKAEGIHGAQRQQLVLMVAKELHKKQPWFHDKISREEGHKRIMSHKKRPQGFFLVRARDDKKTFALTLIFSGEPRHYIIEKHGEKLGIPDGPKFDCLLMLVDHYHNKSDGLLCKLTEPCVCPGYDTIKLNKYREAVGQSSVYDQFFAPRSPSNAERPQSFHQPVVPSPRQGPSRRGSDQRPLPPTPEEKGAAKSPSTKLPPRRNGSFEEDSLQKIYQDIPYTKDMFNLRRDQIELSEELGSGQFGSVRKGIYKPKSGKQVPVAVKTLKKEDVSAEAEMLKEAELMGKYQHKNIVRMIGLCKSECIMLVLELAPLGPLNAYLKQNKEIPQWNICEIMCQVADGMEYLSSHNFVHRDLAARNVLLHNKHNAKISDFGMSKALGRDNNYYEAHEAGKWPLKWYAPECVFYWKFDSKSDIWSYGVTLWEATSYGEKPYKKIKGAQLVQLLQAGERLECPPRCDPEVYEIMRSCWEFDKKDRPTFAELAAKMDYQWHRLLEM